MQCVISHDIKDKPYILNFIAAWKNLVISLKFSKQDIKNVYIKNLNCVFNICDLNKLGNE